MANESFSRLSDNDSANSHPQADGTPRAAKRERISLKQNLSPFSFKEARADAETLTQSRNFSIGGPGIQK